MKLNIKAFALACGITCGLTILIFTFWLIILNSSGEIVNGFSETFIRYSFSWLGGIIGMIWGFVTGLISGAFFAWFYNKIVSLLVNPV